MVEFQKTNEWYNTINNSVKILSIISTNGIIEHKSISSSSSYPIYPAHGQLWSGSEEGRVTIAHTHVGECGQKVPRLKNGLQRERNL